MRHINLSKYYRIFAASNLKLISPFVGSKH